MRVGLVQYAPDWESPAENRKRLTSIVQGRIHGVDLLVFPEMTLTGFSMESEAFAEMADGAGMLFFQQLAADAETHILAGLIKREDDRCYNALVHFDRTGRVEACYRKIHLFSLAGEDRFYAAGRTPVVTRTEQASIGLSVCYDLRFPELYRHYSKQGASVMVDIANWPAVRVDHWTQFLKARAIENQCFMVGVNRVGSDPLHAYCGCSAVYDPLGNEVVCAGDDAGVTVADLDLKQVDLTRKMFPFLNDIKLI